MTLQHVSRRRFVQNSLALSAACSLGSRPLLAASQPTMAEKSTMRFGLVTYLWGQHMTLPEVIEACAESGLEGVELRTQHKHAVEPSLTTAEREEVRKRFADSRVVLVGYGSNAEYHSNDPAKLKQNIEQTKEFIRLMHDCGGSGVKVKPNSFVNGIPREQTIEQIGKALNEVAAYGEKYGQQIRVEVHGPGTSEIPVMRDIFQVADHPNAAICWNSNGEDLQGEGLQANFQMLRGRFGATCHVRELDDKEYPYAELIKLMVDSEYDGWILLEARTDPQDKVAAMAEQKKIFDRLISAAQG
jgi:sugar phosphate isomerase/epimerase